MFFNCVLSNVNMSALVNQQQKMKNNGIRLISLINGAPVKRLDEQLANLLNHVISIGVVLVFCIVSMIL